MARKQIGDIAAGRLAPGKLDDNVADIAPPRDRQGALLAAQRCYYCYDAPCTQACPTGIDIPEFIRAISPTLPIPLPRSSKRCAPAATSTAYHPVSRSSVEWR